MRMTYTEIKMLTGMPILENDNYEMHVAEIPGVDIPCYAIVNKRYGVVEMHTSVLANAKKLCEMLDRWEKEPPSEGDVIGLPDLGPGYENGPN